MALTAVQTTVTAFPAKGAPGMLYDASEVVDIIEKVAAEAIPFGSFVNFGTDGTCELPDSAGEVTTIARGIALHDPNKGTGVGYAANDIVAVLVQGRVWIQAETGQALTQHSVPYARHTASGGNTQKGAWRSDADTATAAVPQNMFMFSAAPSGGLGVLQVNPVSTGPAGPTA